MWVCECVLWACMACFMRFHVFQCVSNSKRFLSHSVLLTLSLSLSLCLTLSLSLSFSLSLSLSLSLSVSPPPLAIFSVRKILLSAPHSQIHTCHKLYNSTHCVCMCVCVCVCVSACERVCARVSV